MSISLAEAIEEAKLRIDCEKVELSTLAKTYGITAKEDALRTEREILCLRIFLQVAESISRKHSNAS